MSLIDIKILKMGEIHPYEKNPRKNKDAVKYVAESIKEFGFKVPIVIDKNNTIVAGHTRYLASKKLKLKEVPCIIADDLTEEQIKAYRLADNKVGEFSSWDDELLMDELLDLTATEFDMDCFGFDIKLDEEEEKEEKAPKDLSSEVKETYEVIVTCNNELEQEELFYRLSEEGLNCRVLTL